MAQVKSAKIMLKARSREIQDTFWSSIALAEDSST